MGLGDAGLGDVFGEEFLCRGLVVGWSERVDVRTCEGNALLEGSLRGVDQRDLDLGPLGSY